MPSGLRPPRLYTSRGCSKNVPRIPWASPASLSTMHCVKVYFSLFSYVCVCFAKITCIRSRTCKTMAKLTSFTPQHTGNYKYTHFDNIYIVFWEGERYDGKIRIVEKRDELFGENCILKSGLGIINEMVSGLLLWRSVNFGIIHTPV